MTTIEVITSVERRRRWSREEKLRIVSQSAEPGRTTTQVAREHDIAPSQLFNWRRQLRAEAIANGASGDGFVPVRITNEASSAVSTSLASTAERAIEIRLPNGIVIGVSEAVAVEPLRRVLAALAGR